MHMRSRAKSLARTHKPGRRRAAGSFYSLRQKVNLKTKLQNVFFLISLRHEDLLSAGQIILTNYTHDLTLEKMCLNEVSLSFMASIKYYIHPLTPPNFPEQLAL